MIRSAPSQPVRRLDSALWGTRERFPSLSLRVWAPSCKQQYPHVRPPNATASSSSHASGPKQSVNLIPTAAGTDSFPLHRHSHPQATCNRSPSPGGGGLSPKSCSCPYNLPLGSATAPAERSTLLTSQPFAAHRPLPGPAFGCLKCICSTISAAIFHPSAIRHLHVHSTQKITYKQQLPPADFLSPLPVPIINIITEAAPLWRCFCLRFFSPTPPFGFFTPAPRRDRQFEITNLTFRCLLHSARRAKLPGTIDFPRIVYRCHPKHLINTRSTLPAGPRSLFSQSVKISDTPKMRDARSRGWSWVGASLLWEGGKGKEGISLEQTERWGLNRETSASSVDKLVSTGTAVGMICGTSSITSAVQRGSTNTSEGDRSLMPT